MSSHSRTDGCSTDTSQLQLHFWKRFVSHFQTFSLNKLYNINLIFCPNLITDNRQLATTVVVGGCKSTDLTAHNDIVKKSQLSRRAQSHRVVLALQPIRRHLTFALHTTLMLVVHSSIICVLPIKICYINFTWFFIAVCHYYANKINVWPSKS